MEKPENIKNLDKKKTSHIYQMKESFLSRFEEVLHRKPEILNAFGQKWRLDKCENPDRVQESTDDDGNNYLKISVKPGDKRERNRKALQRGTERAEIQQYEKLNYGIEYVQDFVFQIPKDFALCPRRTVICQWKRNPELTSDDAPLLSLRIKKIDGEYYLVLTDGYRDEIGNPILMKYIIGNDVRFENKINFSDEGKSKVCVKIYVKIGENIQEKTLYEGTISHPTKKGEKAQVYFKFGLYRDCYKHAIRKIKKDKILDSEEKKVQIEEIKKVENIEREKDSYILLKNYSMKESQ